MKIKLPPRDDLDVWGVREDGTRKIAPAKTLVLKQVIDLYPRMLELLRAASQQLTHDRSGHDILVLTDYKPDCIQCQIRALLKQADGE